MQIAKNWNRRIYIRSTGQRKVDLDIFVVKYRIKIGDSLNLKEIYAVVDNNKDNISFYKETNVPIEFEEYTHILSIGRKYLKDVTKHVNDWLRFYGYEWLNDITINF